MSVSLETWAFSKEEMALIFVFKDGIWNKSTWEGTRWQDTPDIAGPENTKNILAKSTMFDGAIKCLKKADVTIAKAVFDLRLKDPDAVDRIVVMLMSVLVYMVDTSVGQVIDRETACNMYNVLFFGNKSDSNAFVLHYGKTFPRELSDDGWRSAFKALIDFVEGWID